MYVYVNMYTYDYFDIVDAYLFTRSNAFMQCRSEFLRRCALRRLVSAETTMHGMLQAEPASEQGAPSLSRDRGVRKVRSICLELRV